MRSCYDDKLVEEQAKLVEQWLNSNTDMDIYDYAYQNGSKELRAYFDYRKKLDEEDRRNHCITN